MLDLRRQLKFMIEAFLPDQGCPQTAGRQGIGQQKRRGAQTAQDGHVGSAIEEHEQAAQAAAIMGEWKPDEQALAMAHLLAIRRRLAGHARGQTTFQQVALLRP